MNNGLTIEQLDFLEQWSREATLIYHYGQAIVNNQIEIWVTQDRMQAKYGENAQYQVEILIKLIDYAIRNKVGILLCGLLDFDIEISYDDLMIIQPDVDAICIMLGYIEKKISLEQFYEEFDGRPVYFLGEYPNNEVRSEFGVLTLKHQSGNYESIPVFINEKHARDYNEKGYPITKTTLCDLKFFDTFGLIIEPRYKYWVEIPPSKFTNM